MKIDKRSAHATALAASLGPDGRTARAKAGAAARWGNPAHLADRYLEASDTAWNVYQTRLSPEQWAASQGIEPAKIAALREYLTSRGVL